MPLLPPHRPTIRQARPNRRRPKPVPRLPKFFHKMVHARQLVAAAETVARLLNLAARERSHAALYLWGGELALRSNYAYWQFDPAFRLLRRERVLTCVEARPVPLPSRWRLDVAKLLSFGQALARRLAAELAAFPPLDAHEPAPGRPWRTQRRRTYAALDAPARLADLDRALARLVAQKLRVEGVVAAAERGEADAC